MARRLYVRIAPLSIGTAVVAAVGLLAAAPASAAAPVRRECLPGTSGAVSSSLKL